MVECLIDEMNQPPGVNDAQFRIQPSEPEIGTLFAAGAASWPTLQSHQRHDQLVALRSLFNMDQTAGMQNSGDGCFLRLVVYFVLGLALS
ncbi:hypothetical protein [Streptomyces sp. NPDC090083]|uniref:hypothetical protein n=1 Tax=Streptomyces sp. NPDC090083 TaxID=3365941 RepID=UPI0037F97A5E